MNISTIIFNADLELLTDEIINKCYKFNFNIYETKKDGRKNINILSGKIVKIYYIDKKLQKKTKSL